MSNERNLLSYATRRDTIKTVQQTKKLLHFLLKFIHKAQLEANIKALGACLTYLMHSRPLSL